MILVRGAGMDTQFDYPHWAGHILSVLTIIGTFLGFVPIVAALAALIWYSIQIFESDTCQKFLDKWRMRRKLRRLSKLTAEHKMLGAEIEALTVVQAARVVAADKLATATHEARRQLANDHTSQAVQEATKEIIESAKLD